MLLRHLHLPPLIPYLDASKLQSTLVAAFLAHKSSPHLHPTGPPPPTIITAEFAPVYTCGRREIPSISPAQIAHLTAPTPLGTAQFAPAPRGGQTTFHGPGQLVAYPLLDLRAHNLGARAYVCLLEQSVIALCARYGLRTKTTENPGVWVDDEKKIAAVGVHLRRNVASHGVAVNVRTELAWFDRIVACGLEGKRTTSLAAEGVDGGATVESVGEELVRIMGERLDGVEGVVRIGVEDV